jgi:hypothetical protein
MLDIELDDLGAKMAGRGSLMSRSQDSIPTRHDPGRRRKCEIGPAASVEAA